MKIYEIGTGYTPIPAQMGAATEIVVEELTKSLARIGKDVTIVDIKTNKRSKTDLPIIEVAVPKKFTSTDVKLGLAHKLKRVVYSIALASKLKKILMSSNEKVVFHFHNQYNMYFFLKFTPEKLRKNCLLAYTNHSYIWHGDWAKIKDTVKKRYFQEVYAMQHADLVYVLNDITRRTLVEYLGIPENRIRMIDNGVNTDIYSPKSSVEIKEIKQKFGLIGKKVFVQIGSICDRKNQLGALKLLTPILKKNPEYAYIYAGSIIDGEYQEKIKTYLREQGIEQQVKYLGELKPGKELNECYAISEAMVFPSKSEGFSLVIIEAMASGIPVIINKKLKFRLADECCRYGDDKEFRRLLSEIILEKEARNAISKRVRSVVCKQYGWDKIAGDYLRTWEK